MKTVFSNKVDIAKGEEFTIGKVIELSQTEYELFSTNLLDEYPFIEEYADKMDRDENGVRNCLLVLCEGEDDGILVNSQGEANARYLAPLPYARQIAILEKFPYLKLFVENMHLTAEHFAKQAIDLQKDGAYAIKYQTIEQYSGRDDIDYPLLIDMLCKYPGIEEIEMDRDGLEIMLQEEQCKEIKVHQPTQEEVNIICANHTLWFNGAEGKHADFSGYLLKDIQIAGNLPNVIFDSAKLINVSFENAMIAYSTFNGAKLYNCNFRNCDGKGIVCKDANFYHCIFDEGSFINSDLTDATFVGGSAEETNFEDSCTQGTSFEEIDLSEASFKGFYEDREQFQKDTMGEVNLEEPQ